MLLVCVCGKNIKYFSCPQQEEIFCAITCSSQKLSLIWNIVCVVQFKNGEDLMFGILNFPSCLLRKFGKSFKLSLLSGKANNFESKLKLLNLSDYI